MTRGRGRPPKSRDSNLRGSRACRGRVRGGGRCGHTPSRPISEDDTRRVAALQQARLTRLQVRRKSRPVCWIIAKQRFK